MARLGYPVARACALSMVAVLGFLSTALAQGVDVSASDMIPEARSAQLIGRDVAVPGSDAAGTLDPFGSNLFSGGFSGDGEDGLNPQYLLQPGDRVSIRIWGATELNQSLTLDRQGSIFLPSVGPIKLGGVRNSALNDHVAAAVGRIYTDDVRVYASLDSSQPVGVFVTGMVTRPGRFAGTPSTSALHFIDSAGGIDPARGSYRRVQVLRDGETMAVIDLYEFLRHGTIESIQFQDGDTIVVAERGPVIAITGAIANESLYELDGDGIGGGPLMERAMPLPAVSHVGVSGIRDDRPMSSYMSIEAFADFELVDGDSVHFAVDRHEPVIVVDIEGAHLGNSRFVLPRGTRLDNLLDYVEVDPRLAAIDSISIKRKGIAVRQQRAIEESLARLEARYLTASSATDAESAIRAREAELISRFVANARKVEPTGRLVIAEKGAVRDVLLQNGDTVVIPTVSESVLLSGEVLISQAILFEQGMDARDYIARAGGFSDQADRSRLVVISPDGRVRSGRNLDVGAGDEVIVLPAVPSKNLQLAATLVDIVYKVAVAAAVAINL